jgi:two-component system LytT family response regulator
LRSLIIDDEFSARSRLRRLLKEYSSVEVVGEAEDGVQGIDQIVSLTPDLVFLDIEMPRLNGFEMLKAMPKVEIVPLVVFITGYDEHALAAFEAEALAYLLKPIEDHRLASVISRASLLVQNTFSAAEEKRRVVNLVSRIAPRIEHVVAKRQGRLVLLRPNELLYFTAEDGLVKAHTATESLEVDLTLNELEQGLPSQRFFRTHRSSLVNLSHVREIDPHFRSSYILVMDDSARSTIQVSERQAKLLRERIKGL